MRPSTQLRVIAVLLACLGPAELAAADPASGAAQCRRFAASDSAPKALAPRLGRLCVRLIEANASPAGLSETERAAATRLGAYLAVVGELELRRGAAGVAGSIGGRPTTETARYLIADRMGLLDLADALAPDTSRRAELR